MELMEGDGPGGPLPAPSHFTGFRSARSAQIVPECSCLRFASPSSAESLEGDCAFSLTG